MNRNKVTSNNATTKRRYQKPHLKKYKSLKKTLVAASVGITEI